MTPVQTTLVMSPLFKVVITPERARVFGISLSHEVEIWSAYGTDLTIPVNRRQVLNIADRQWSAKSHKCQENRESEFHAVVQDDDSKEEQWMKTLERTEAASKRAHENSSINGN